MIKILIGGSPCTYWSVAQKKGREVEAEGLGWELFRNYLIAKEKFKPDFFLYENNKSAAQPIKDQISHELGVELMHINSALVSAQNRQRFYAFNWNIDQPADRGIMLKDILEQSHDSKQYRVYSPEGKATTLCGEGGGRSASAFRLSLMAIHRQSARRKDTAGSGMAGRLRSSFTSSREP